MLEWALVHGAHHYGTPAWSRIGLMPDAPHCWRSTWTVPGRCRAMPEARLSSRRRAGRSSSAARRSRYLRMPARNGAWPRPAPLDAAGEFDHVVINDTVASATAELERPWIGQLE